MLRTMRRLARALTLVPALALALALAAAFALAPAAGRAEEPNVPAAAPEAHRAACAHYVNRAKFQPRSRDAALEVTLADSCTRALRSLYGRFDTSPYEARHARGYLNRLTAFKDTVIAINMDRMFGADRTRRTRLSGPVQPISASGEYLIARQMGVIGAYRAWADVTDFVLAQD